MQLMDFEEQIKLKDKYVHFITIMNLKLKKFQMTIFPFKL